MESNLTMGFRLDENGYIIERPVVNLNDELPNNVILTPPIMPFIKPKWNGTEWIEGESNQEKQERESILLLESIYPTQEQIEDAKLEIKSIQIMTELGVLV